MSGVLRPWMLQLAQKNLFQPIWSDRIGLEWRRNAARIWPIASELLEREWQDMQAQFDGANVSRWPLTPTTLYPTLKHSDAKDWHVIEAAWLAKQLNPEQAVGIVTLNIKDFSRSELRQLGIDLWDPDRLLCNWFKTHQLLTVDSLKEVVADLVETGRRHPAPLEDFVKRERLFRFNKLLMAQRP